jgi:HAD superfamily phosphoserine phosphatase-like hydrolase
VTLLHSHPIGKYEVKLSDPRTSLAIYDMDKTITRKATFGPFIWHVVRHYRPWRLLLLPAMGAVSLAYLLRLISRKRLKEINLGLLLGRRISKADADVIATSFAAETFQTNIMADALARFESDRAEGFRIILATASYQLYVDKIAALSGISDVIATRCGPSGPSHFLAEIEGENCYAQAKLDMIKAWLDGKGIVREKATIRFYSDHVSDAPTLDWADEAFAVNPHPPLARLAQEHEWAVYHWD